MILNDAMNIQNDIITWRRALHQIPETGLHLPMTANYVIERLNEMGISYKTFDGHSGILAWIGDPARGKTIGLRADMDALEIKEETGVSFKSEATMPTPPRSSGPRSS